MKLRVKDLIGRQVQLTRELRTNGGDVFAVGTVLVVDNSWRGRFHLSTKTRYIRKVHRDSFVLYAPSLASAGPVADKPGDQQHDDDDVDDVAAAEGRGAVRDAPKTAE